VLNPYKRAGEVKINPPFVGTIIHVQAGIFIRRTIRCPVRNRISVLTVVNLRGAMFELIHISLVSKVSPQEKRKPDVLQKDKVIRRAYGLPGFAPTWEHLVGQLAISAVLTHVFRLQIASSQPVFSGCLPFLRLPSADNVVIPYPVR